MMFATFSCILRFLFFFFNDTATTEIYTLSLHDALPIWACWSPPVLPKARSGSPSLATNPGMIVRKGRLRGATTLRSEEHTSELQSRQYLVCRLLLEKKKKLHVCAPVMSDGSTVQFAFST